MRIALFITCFNDTLFPHTGRSVVTLLERLGHDVVFPEEQTCCGQMHANSGYAPESRALAQRFVRIFAAAEAEVVVTPSASCAASLRHELARLAAEPGTPAPVAEAAAALRPRLFELTQLLVERLGVEDVGAHYPHRVAYHPTCHALRDLRVGDAPLRLLRAVGGIRLLELDDAETCCGFGGTFAVKNPDVSAAMASDKIRALLDSGAEVVTAADNSCLLHLEGALRRQRAGVRVAHIADILAATRAGAPAR
jgi:L-lactate dehydrogenase complex protein LldE